MWELALALGLSGICHEEAIGMAYAEPGTDITSGDRGNCLKLNRIGLYYIHGPTNFGARMGGSNWQFDRKDEEDDEDDDDDTVYMPQMDIK